MTILANLDPATDDAAEADLLYTQQAAGPRKRTFGSLWRNVLGRTATAQRAFFGATPIAQPAGADQAAVPATPISDAASGTYGATEQALINDLTAQVNAQTTLINQMRSDLVALGLIKGSA